jgi:hypothetical protein
MSWTGLAALVLGGLTFLAQAARLAETTSLSGDAKFDFSRLDGADWADAALVGFLSALVWFAILRVVGVLIRWVQRLLPSSSARKRSVPEVSRHVDSLSHEDAPLRSAASSTNESTPGPDPSSRDRRLGHHLLVVVAAVCAGAALIVLYSYGRIDGSSSESGLDQASESMIPDLLAQFTSERCLALAPGGDTGGIMGAVAEDVDRFACGSLVHAFETEQMASELSRCTKLAAEQPENQSTDIEALARRCYDVVEGYAGLIVADGRCSTRTYGSALLSGLDWLFDSYERDGWLGAGVGPSLREVANAAYDTVGCRSSQQIEAEALAAAIRMLLQDVGEIWDGHRAVYVDGEPALYTDVAVMFEAYTLPALDDLDLLIDPIESGEIAAMRREWTTLWSDYGDNVLREYAAIRLEDETGIELVRSDRTILMKDIQALLQRLDGALRPTRTSEGDP